MIGFQFSTLQIGALLLASVLILVGVCLAIPSLLHLVRAVRGPLERLAPNRFRVGTRLALASLTARPRRTMRALVPLIIAVAIVIAAATAAGTANTSITRVAAARFPCDIELSTLTDAEQATRLQSTVERLPGVAATARLSLSEHALRSGDRVFAEALFSAAQSDWEHYQRFGVKGPPLTAQEILLSPAGAERLELTDGQKIDVFLAPYNPPTASTKEEFEATKAKQLAALEWQKNNYRTYRVRVMDHQPTINLLVPPSANPAPLQAICVRLTNPSSINAISDVLSTAQSFGLPQHFVHNIAGELHSQQVSIHRMLLFSTLLAAITTAVAFIGITNALISSALSRRHQISTLAALGMSRTQLWTMFVVEGIVLSLVGVGVGIATGISLGLLIVSALAGSTQWLAVTVPWSPVMLCILIAIGGGLFGALAAGWQTLRPSPEAGYPQG
ncbi:ABC transporter permease [Buchananella hordeovulneris]|uniref:ABC transporter permease n=1 Tax=Buchananella hordeovulneris TaxID=52770 RepID=UPI0026DCCD5F|nr:ABC transporter permease [Buchananella hordeovulneris]MDO5079834.1 ABC transporter permease [Buchananella hordeovulneris]